MKVTQRGSSRVRVGAEFSVLVSAARGVGGGSAEEGRGSEEGIPPPAMQRAGKESNVKGARSQRQAARSAL